MGYYTDYTLSVYRAKKQDDGSIVMVSDIPKIVEIQIEEEIDLMNVFRDGNIKDSYYANDTWYNHEEDMRLLSSKFPDIVFWLSGDGDNHEDMWQKFFVAGKMQPCYARIIYDDFDASKLDDGALQDTVGRKYSYQAG